MIYQEEFSVEGIKTLFKQIINKPFYEVKRKWEEFKNHPFVQDHEQEFVDIFNRNLKLNLTDLQTVETYAEDISYQESFRGLWEAIKTEMFPTLAFYPALQCWLEIDKIIKTNGVTNQNLKTLVVYGIFWLLLVSARYFKRKLSDSKE